MTLTTLPNTGDTHEEVNFDGLDFHERLIELMTLIEPKGKESSLIGMSPDSVETMRGEMLRITIEGFKYPSQISANSAFIRAAYNRIMLAEGGIQELAKKN